MDFNQRSRLMNVDKVFKAEISSIVRLTDMEKLFHIRILDPAERDRFTFQPGQFVMLEVPGYGEVPISISSSPTNRGFIELCIRKAGVVTGLLHRAQRGARVGIRGPFGTYFPLEKMKGHDILLIAGGLGLAPLRAPIFCVAEDRPDYRNVHILYGTRSPDQLLFNYQYEQWSRIDGVNLQIIVEKPDKDWKGEVGLITKLLENVKVEPKMTFAIVCGPPIMFKFVCGKLNAMGVPMHRMFVSLERRMHCGMGKCCRCNIGSTYTCLDGPVFDYWSVLNLKEAI
ncbi:MAG: FAD/NAD(P)-binding protein [bacterium]